MAAYSRTDLDGAVLPARFQPQYPQSLRHNHPLLTVVGWWNTLKELQTLKGSGTPRSLVRGHTADGTVQNFGRSAVVEGARLLGIHDMALVKEVVVAQLPNNCVGPSSQGMLNDQIPCCGRSCRRC